MTGTRAASAESTTAGTGNASPITALSHAGRGIVSPNSRSSNGSRNMQ